MYKNKKKNLWLLEEIKEVYQAGIHVCVNGTCLSSCQAEELSMVFERGGDFMRDYIGDEQGKIVEMHYDEVREERRQSR